MADQVINNAPLEIEGMIPSALMSGGLSLAGSLATNFFNAKQAERANAENERLAKETRDWQERMSNTAKQREARDLELAGFNRMLASGFCFFIEL